MKTVFFGTPEMAVPALEALTQISEVVGVVCQPDRPAGRGMQLRAPAVKAWSAERGLSVFQPVKVRDGQLRGWLEDRNPDVAVVLAYGRILPPDVLDRPRHGCINLHASLLPRHRGAAPIQWAILSGDDHTGISLMQMDAGLDTGPVYAQHSLVIDPLDDAGSLTSRLSDLAGDVLRLDLARVVAGELKAVPQDPALATHAPPIEHADQRLDFAHGANQLERRVRALSPRPGAVALVRGRRLKIHSARAVEDPVDGPLGRVSVRKGRMLVATGSGTLELQRLQLEGKGVQSASDIANGRGIRDGDELRTAD